MNIKTETPQGPRILVVEDEPFIAMLLGDMLEELGYAITASLGHVAESLQYLSTNAVDLALLDVNLGTEKIDPVADLLADRGCRFIFTTGYGQAGVPDKYSNRPVLQKPFQINQLAEAIKGQLEALGSGPKLQAS